MLHAHGNVRVGADSGGPDTRDLRACGGGDDAREHGVGRPRGVGRLLEEVDEPTHAVDVVVAVLLDEELRGAGHHDEVVRAGDVVHVAGVALRVRRLRDAGENDAAVGRAPVGRARHVHLQDATAGVVRKADVVVADDVILPRGRGGGPGKGAGLEARKRDVDLVELLAIRDTLALHDLVLREGGAAWGYPAYIGGTRSGRRPALAMAPATSGLQRVGGLGGVLDEPRVHPWWPDEVLERQRGRLVGGRYLSHAAPPARWTRSGGGVAILCCR